MKQIIPFPIFHSYKIVCKNQHKQTTCPSTISEFLPNLIDQVWHSLFSKDLTKISSSVFVCTI